MRGALAVVFGEELLGFLFGRWVDFQGASEDFVL